MQTTTPATEIRARRTRKPKEQVVTPVVEPEVEVTPVKVEQEVRLCECGCNEAVSPKSRFRPGHDARHRGNLLRRFDTGEEAAAVELMNRRWASNDELEARHERSEAKAKAKLQRQIDREEKARVNAEARAAKPKRETQSSWTAKAGRELARKQRQEAETVAATA